MDREPIDLTVAVTRHGSVLILEGPAWVEDNFADRGPYGPGDFPGLTTEPGLYRLSGVVAPGTSGAHPFATHCFRVLQYEEIRMVPTGAFVPVMFGEDRP